MSMGKNVTVEDFDRVKMLQGVNVGSGMIHKITELSPTTVNRMMRSETFESYKEFVAQQSVKKVPVTAPIPAIETFRAYVNGALDTLVKELS